MLINKNKRIQFIKFLRDNIRTPMGDKPSLVSVKNAVDCIWADLYDSDTSTDESVVDSYIFHMKSVVSGSGNRVNAKEKLENHLGNGE